MENEISATQAQAREYAIRARPVASLKCIRMRYEMTQEFPLAQEEIAKRLDTYLEVEFSFRDTSRPARALADLAPAEQGFLLDWVRRVASAHVEVAYQFALKAPQALTQMEPRLIEAWALQAMDSYDKAGLRPALGVIADLDRFLRIGQHRAAGAILEEEMGVLLHFVQGLAGRRLRVAEGEVAYTDSETIFLPAVLSLFPTPRENFRLYKAMAAHLWAQTCFGTFGIDPSAAFAPYPDPARALRLFHRLETIRLDAVLQRELPGLYRDMLGLRLALNQAGPLFPWSDHVVEALLRPTATAADSLELLRRLYPEPVPEPVCYQGELRPEAVAILKSRRLPREKAQLRTILRRIQDEQGGAPPAERLPGFTAKRREEDPNPFAISLSLADQPLVLPPEVKNLLTSIVQDLGTIPPDYLVPAGPGEYDPRLLQPLNLDPEQVWQGSYHEEGAFLYREWDFRRRHYRKNWCVVRERQVTPVWDDFVSRSRAKHGYLLKQLRRAFEAMAEEDRILRRQSHGDAVDFDAFVEAWVDGYRGLEMSNQVFTRLRRQDRRVAVILMVDISGSTKGWINEAERESLILLSTALEALGDSYAIYGFSGLTRKRCEIFRVKAFEDPADAGMFARIGGLRPQDYTRMGAAVRHLSDKLRRTEARTKLLMSLSDGKPEDYDGYYLGQYGIEDTRQALLEARQIGIHPFCITIDDQARDYLPHMYGPANYALVSDVSQLPRQVAEIYRKLTG